MAERMRTSTALFARLTDRTHGLFLHDAQQLHLHVQRQIGHFVEKQRAALGALNQTLLITDGAREAAALVTEEFALHQLRGNRAAVHGDERAVAARAGFMDQACDQFLAGAGLPADVHRCLAAGDAPDHLAQLLHDRRAAEQSRRRQCRASCPQRDPRKA